MAGLDDIKEGVNVGRELLTDVRIADDQRSMHYVAEIVNQVSQNYEVRIYVKGYGNIQGRWWICECITLNCKRINQIIKFCHLGSQITDDGDRDIEIRGRNAMERQLLA